MLSTLRALESGVEGVDQGATCLARRETGTGLLCRVQRRLKGGTLKCEFLENGEWDEDGFLKGMIERGFRKGIKQVAGPWVNRRPDQRQLGETMERPGIFLREVHRLDWPRHSRLRRAARRYGRGWAWPPSWNTLGIKLTWIFVLSASTTLLYSAHW